MADLTIADIIQQYNQCVISYKGKPHKVKNIGAEIKLLDLITQRNKLVDFYLRDFSPLFHRLGFVNIDETAIYVARKPVKMFFVGINTQNCTFTKCRLSPCPNNIDTAADKVLSMECTEFSDMLLGHYPSLQDAYKRACTFNGTVAFDKQFAICCNQKVYYKGYKVGIYDFKVNNICFENQYSYLSLLLNGNYEKVKRTFGKTPS